MTKLEFYVSERTWQMIRDQFSEADREALRAATIRLQADPIGAYVNLEALEPELRRKLLAAVVGKGETR